MYRKKTVVAEDAGRTKAGVAVKARERLVKDETEESKGDICERYF